jgi:hypothetical protein
MNEQVLQIGWMTAASLTAGLVGLGGLSPAFLDRSWTRLAGVRMTVAAVLMLPAWFLFGTPGLAALLLVAVPMAVATGSVAADTTAHSSADADESMWSPLAALRMAVELAVRFCLILAAWLILRGADLNGWVVNNWTTPHPAAVDEATHWLRAGVVGWVLLLVNTYVASQFVTLLLPPDTGAGADGSAGPRASYSVKLGPVTGWIEPDQTPAVRTADRVGVTIGVVERFLAVVLILGRAEAAIGLVIAAKTIARFRQLDERHFAERYLVGTLASITIAVASGLLTRYALLGS